MRLPVAIGSQLVMVTRVLRPHVGFGAFVTDLARKFGVVYVCAFDCVIRLFELLEF